MVVIGFDTATEDTAVCAIRHDKVLYESYLGLSEKGRPLHTAALLTEVEHAVAAAGGWDAVGEIAVGVGPGTYTGLRIGLSTAKALGLSCGVPVRGACTLDALGRALGEAVGTSDRLAVIDARRGEVFYALYASSGERLWEPQVGSPAALAEQAEALAEPLLAAGSGAVRFRHELASRGIEVPDDADPVHRVAARHICALAVTETSDDSVPVAPIYLRLPDAQRWRERDTSQTGQ